MIPTFNCAKYLRQTLESVLIQAPDPEQMQIEVVDDCSTKDDPEAVVREIGQGRVGFYRQPQNVGHTRNFETCLQRSRGHLIHLLHGDDAVRQGFYSTMREAFIVHPEIGAAFCRNLVMDSESNWIDLSPVLASRSCIMVNLVEVLAERQRIQTPSMVVRREVYETLGLFDRRLSWTEDWEMWSRVALNYPVWHEVEPLAIYRTHPHSNTGQFKKSGESLKDILRLYSIIDGRVPGDKGRRLSRLGRRWFADDALKSARSLLASRDAVGAAIQLRGALRLCPSAGVLSAIVSFGIGSAFKMAALPFKRLFAFIFGFKGVE